MHGKKSYDQVVYLLQGGGALGTYQAGVCEALLEFSYPPDWIVGTSIGAINAAIIAGNKPEDRVAKLKEFWDSITLPMPAFPTPTDNTLLTEWSNFLGAEYGAMVGQPGFFTPRLINPWLELDSTPDKLSYYDTSELRTTLEKVIDFDLLNQKQVRLSLTAVRIKTGATIRFDNTRQTIGPEHVMASCALPPGFPAIKIDGEYYWDGGLSSNTPFTAVVEEKTSNNLLCFIVNLYSFPKRIPTSMMDIVSSMKQLLYASRHEEILHYFCQLNYLQNTISSLSKTNIHNKDLDSALKTIADAGHPTSLHVVRFQYKDCPSDLWSKDFNFSPQVLKEHWQAGYSDAKKALKKPNWSELVQEESCPIIHEF